MSGHTRRLNRRLIFQVVALLGGTNQGSVGGSKLAMASATASLTRRSASVSQRTVRVRGAPHLGEAPHLESSNPQESVEQHL